MNYNRRANRPDGSHYREMRRRHLKGADEGVAFRPGRGGLPWVLTVVVLLGGVAAAAWVYLR